VQWIAEATYGRIIVGRSIIVLLFYIVKFIGFSYRAAMDPDNGFLLSFFGFTFGVGLCEELTKALPVVFYVRGGNKLDWRGACLWGLASGIGFGVAEGIMYSSEFYNGLSGGGAYFVRFISCVGLHATWGASVAIMAWRRRDLLQNGESWQDLAVSLLYILAVPMVLHGLYDTLLKQDMAGIALLVALASFGWLIALTEWTRSTSPQVSRRLERRAAMV
jgi:RsiW-degrading membrane proteinase PrsW (M82 family)